MKNKIIKIILLLLLVGCGNLGYKFKAGDCIKGDLFTFTVLGRVLDDYTIVNKENGYISRINWSIAEKAFRKVNCE